MNQQITVFEFDRHLILICYKVRREKSTIKLHAFNHFDRGLAAATFFDSDNAILANSQKRFSKHIADGRIVVASNRSDLLDFFLALGIDRNRNLVDFCLDGFNSLGNASRESHWIGPCGNHLETFTENRFGQYGRGRRSIACNVIRLACGFLNQLSA